LAQAHRADLVFVDHLRKLGDRPELPEVKRLGWITNRTKDMAKQLNLHACMLVQLNRGADADENRAPELKHLRDSGEIEEDADLVMMLHGLPVNEITRQRPTRDTDLWIRKARDGIRDARVKLRYNLKTQQFAGRADD
jgi:replicative DNA helicase